MGEVRVRGRIREGNADTHHTGLEVIALISPNYYQSVESQWLGPMDQEEGQGKTVCLLACFACLLCGSEYALLPKSDSPTDFTIKRDIKL